MSRKTRDTRQSGDTGEAATVLGATESTRELLRRLQLDVSMKLDGILHGDYRGLIPGNGSELGETREYQAGDDVRRIDWNVTARLDGTHVRETIADRELETTVLVDLSPSLDFGTFEQEKRDLALAATGAIGMLTARVGNRFGAVLAQPDEIRAIAPRQGKQHILGVLHQVASAPRASDGSVDLAEAIRRTGLVARRRGLVVIISDFISPEKWEHDLAKLATRHDVIATEILDPRELQLPDVGVITLTDPETGRQRDVPTNRRKVREAYAEAALAQRESIAGSISASGAAHLQLRTDRDWLLDLARFVTSRKARRHAARTKAS